MLLFFVLVGIHEWGHYYFAKRAGILVREFAIGFGPKLFSFKKNETRFTLRLLPIGGFARMAGEDPENVQIQAGQTVGIRKNENQEIIQFVLDQLDNHVGITKGEVKSIDLEKDLTLELLIEGNIQQFRINSHANIKTKGYETQIAPLNRQFNHKSVWQRTTTIVMGPVMNFVLAIVLFALLILMIGVNNNVKLLEVVTNGSADKAGLKHNDIIVTVDGELITNNRNKLITLIEKAPDKKMIWVIERNKKILSLQVVPRNDNGVGKVGVTMTGDKRPASFIEILNGTYDQMITSTTGILTGFKMLITGQFKLDDLGGPVRTTQVTFEFAKKGIEFFIFWSATLSLYLGLFNLLPFPALDGSRLVFLAIEAIRGKPINPSRESMVHFVGFAILMLLMLAVTYNDIWRFFRS